jgi:hypothetical protein
MGLFAARRLEIPHRAFYIRVTKPLLYRAQVNSGSQAARCERGAQTLGFNLDMHNLPAFGQVSIRGLRLILSGPGASGSRPMPDGRQQEPGGWNRVLLQV